ncbi:hypothetical protein [Frankia sp. AgB32]|uniref:hypothetical protein n=1 Tax=Frankia sp. AgB32 TaxID=631119 RepID=UPI00200E37F8|nr:hypothetical protein [Frankia sp. AgB32]MCK9897895.1 hypothetical protein [Frankia sp. AgB32]
MPSKPQPDPRFRKSIQAAFNTALLTDELIEITNDGTYQPYATGRSLSIMWDSIINAMQPVESAPPAPDVQARIDAANKVLYSYDENKEIIGKTAAYKNYQKNSSAYAQTKKDYSDAQAAAMSDPAKAETWPQDSILYQNKVDSAWDDFGTEGAEKVEAALDILQSVGVSLQAHIIAQARKLYDVWNLGIAGVPAPIAYAQISPTTWYDHNDKELGFTGLESSQSSYSEHGTSHTDRFSRRFYSSHDSSVSGSAGIPFLGIGFSAGGSASHGEESTHSDSQSDRTSSHTFHDTASNVSIKLEWGLCTIQRPWLLTDLFHMQGWYLVGNKKDAISTGSVDDQIKDEHHLMPSIPTQFLIVRDVEIHADNWGEDGNTLDRAHSESHADAEHHRDSQSGRVGFLCFGGKASHSSSEAHGEVGSSGTTDSDAGWSWSFENNTLTISGTQIVGWISEVVPSCPPGDDKNAKPPAAEEAKDTAKSATTTSANETVPSHA